MTQVIQKDPFSLHKRAFDLSEIGDLSGSECFFKEAMDRFAELIHDSRFWEILLQRASTIRGYNNEDVAKEFLNKLPSWLLDLHYERAARYLSQREIQNARSHWKLLEGARDLIRLTGIDYLNICRDNLLLRFLNESHIHTSDELRQKFLRTAELLLKMDPGNNNGRMLAIRGYIMELKIGLDRLRSRSGKKKSDAGLLKPYKGSTQRIHTLINLAAKKLNRHLKRLNRVKSIDQFEIAQGYIYLSDYYGSKGENLTALRMAHRARRLKPQDQEIRRLIREIRRRRR